MNPTLEQLARYVVQELQRGVPEATLFSMLRQSGWTQEWIAAAFSVARQRAVPVAQNQLRMPGIQQTIPVRPATPRLPHRPEPTQALTRPVSSRKTSLPLSGIKKALLIAIAVLSVVVVGLGTYRTIMGFKHAAAQRVIRDADRREDLSVLLSNLSDYYLTHKSYPTRTQLNTASFVQENGFNPDSITDPKWSQKDNACTKDGKPSLAGTVTPSCYTYEVTTDNGGVCNDASIPCTKVKVSIWLEVDKQAYAVTFDKNTQID